jgi:hypothetical protein
MTDPSVVQVPLDPSERPILDRLLAIRDKLYILKQDKSTYVKSHDVISLHDQVIEQVHKLNTIRNNKGPEQNRGSWHFDSGYYFSERHSLNALFIGMYMRR